MKIHPLGTELFHAGQTDGQTDVKMVIIAFLNLKNQRFTSF